MVTVYDDIEQGTEEWQELRSGKYTGSNAHRLLRYGAIPYALTNTDSFGGNFYTRRGHVLEQEAIELYETIKRTVVGRPGFVTNDKFPGCGYSPDGLREDRVVEVKCFSAERHLKVADSIPLEILAQIHFGMMICQRKLADLILYNPKLPPKQALKIIAIKRNPAVERNFKRILAEGIKK